ncbi:M23 family metallopeptidase [Pontibacter sp. KCTC 32443]|uniref:M23 family metallopeptidase n=1 Tax=Pontibacter TaxID=323449 RepID=UPI00164CEF8A|nr:MULTISPECIES: M23 family metallopeptidase [Pontibacter]MBC5772628.1 M23 family metallopeptidase [Pontibacter sp. KCTC 32443]
MRTILCNWKKIFPLLLLLIFTSCVKDSEENGPIIDEDPSLDMIKEEYVKRSYDSKLHEKVNDSTTFYWQPIWQTSTTKVKDKYTYTYIQLKPILKKNESDTQKRDIEFIGVKKFLIVKKSATDLTFMMASYNFEEPITTTNNSSSLTSGFKNFTGHLIIKDLSNNNLGVIDYENGIRKTTEQATQGSASVNDWQCVPRYTCYWSMTCGTTTYGASTTSIDGYCEEPRTVANSTTCSWDQSWYYTGRYYEGDDCVWVEEPPLPGDGSGGCGTCTPPEYGETPMPCPGDFVKDPKITPSNGWNIKGGRRGYTRSEGKKYHDGLDISVVPGTPLGSMYGGTVVDIVSSFPTGPAGYKKDSYGNYITIRTTLPSGEVIDIKYNHLDRVDLNVGDVVYPGTVIGLSGQTGNAWAKGVVPHVHVQVFNAVNPTPLYKRSNGLDPEVYSATKYDSSGTPINTPC